MNWTEISKQPGLTEEFIREHENKVNWKMIAKHQKLSTQFIIKHTSKISIQCLKQNPHLSFTEEEQNMLFPDYFIKMEKHKRLLEQMKELDVILERATSSLNEK